MERGDGGENRPIWPPDLANHCFCFSDASSSFPGVEIAGNCRQLIKKS